MTEPTTPAFSIVTDFKDATPGRYLADAFVDGKPSGWTVVVVHADGHQTFEPLDQSEAAYAQIPHEPHEAIALPDRWDQVAVYNPESFVHLATEEEAAAHAAALAARTAEALKPEATPLTVEEIEAMSPEERRALEAGAILDWDAHIRRAHENFQEDPPRPLPRHRPPTFKDPTKTVAPRLPGNVFGAPRAVR